MKRDTCVKWVTCWALAGMCLAVPARAEVVDQVVATVDTEAILLSEIMFQVAPVAEELRMTSGSQREFNRALERQIRATLEQAIESKILYREALLSGLSIHEDAIERELTRLKKSFDSNEAFLEELENAGETMSDLRERMKKQTLARAMAARKMEEFESEVAVSESEVAQYYEDHKEKFSRPERVRCRQIFLAKEAGGPQPEVLRARLEAVAREIENGASFSQLAEAFSQGAGAEDGGLIGWVNHSTPDTPGDLVKPLEDAVFAVQEGEVTGIVETDFGFHLLKVEKREEAGLASLDEVRKEIEPELRTQAAQERYDKWIAELRKRSQVRVFI